jgi:hypothetical protein
VSQVLESCLQLGIGAGQHGGATAAAARRQALLARYAHIL